MIVSSKYTISNFALLITVLLAVVISVIFKWNYDPAQINFMGGDAKDYYSSLVSIFINHDLQAQNSNEWYLLKTQSGVINVHPIGVAVMILPFFLIGYGAAAAFSLPVDGYSLPFQIAVAAAAVFYCVLGLNFIKKLMQLNKVTDKICAIIILLLFFGTNLLHYTLSEAGMSHVYSFALIAAFMFYTCRLVALENTLDLLISSVIFGLVLLVRPNNVLIGLSVFIWFRNFDHCKEVFARLFRSRFFYLSVGITILILSLQSMVWYLQTGELFHNTYKRDGFYWLQPQVFKMLFGFDGGFFIYAPLCFLLLFGLYSIYKENRFSFFATGVLILILFYFFGSYWAYTYFDGLGIRVLVDYYAVFAFVGAKFFEHLSFKSPALNGALSMALVCLVLNLVYCYQANRGILLRSGMTYTKWKYVFLKTGAEYQNCLGGSNELRPYAASHPAPSLDTALSLPSSFNFAGNEYGPALAFERLGFDSNRLQIKVDCVRKETYANSSSNAQICVNVEDPETKKSRSYTQFKLNETPSVSCCETKEYNYTTNVVGDFKAGDKLSVYLWNMNKEPFLLDKFSVEVYNYNYQLN